MRRWNGWGEEQTTYPLPISAGEYLAEVIGDGQPIPDASLEETLTSVPASQLPKHPLISTDPYERLLHARGQSLPDWVALRHGNIGVFPDGVAFPAHESDIKELLDFARQTETHLIPYGGGTSVVGHINPLSDNGQVLTIDLSRMSQLIAIDETSRLATFGAGIRGPDLEKQLNMHGYTLGHFPQSFELSTLGGWIATRSSGQQSLHYGRIEDLFAGGHLETFLGPIDINPIPASAAGPDLRHFILGSEGRLGVITNAALRVRSIPTQEAFYGVFFRNWQSGVDAVRDVAQAGIPVSMMRLSDPKETETTLALSGKDEMLAWADRGLRLLKYAEDRCLLIFGVTGDRQTTQLARRQTLEIARSHGGLNTGKIIGETWRKSRFITPYLRNTLWKLGYALDTLETAVRWSKIIPTAQAIKRAIQMAISGFDERTLVFAHLSHMYPDGASIYVTYLFRRSLEPEKTLERWRSMKEAASDVIIHQGGTISHQHGVGIDHAPYLVEEKGDTGIAVLREAFRHVDPLGLLNRGKLLE